MKKRRTNQAAFVWLCVLPGLLVFFAGVFLVFFATANPQPSTRHASDQLNRVHGMPAAPAGGVFEAWVARYSGPGNDYDGGVAIVCDGSGNVYVTGESVGAETGADYLTIKYNSSGEEQWVARYDGGFGDAATAMAVDSSGNIYITGQSWSTKTSQYDYATVKYNAQGQQQWVARYDGPANDYDYPTVIAVDSSGNVYVTGESTGLNALKGDWDCTTIKYNSRGQQEWATRYNGPANSNDWGTGIALDKSGNVYVTGGSVLAGISSEYITIKYDSAGQEQWVAHYHGTGNGNDGATGLAIDSSGNICVTGSSFNSNNNFDCVTIKYDPAGQETWVARYDGSIHLNDYGYAIAIDNSDNVSVTGAGQVSPSEFNYLTIRYNSAGQEQWVAQSDAGGYAVAVATDSSGNTYITGTGGVTTPDYSTIKYDALGQEQWIARYNGPGNGADDAEAIAVDGSGNVYVTGVSFTSQPFNSDAATIKYVQGATPSPTPTPPSPTATPTSTPRARPTPRPRPSPPVRP